MTETGAASTPPAISASQWRQIVDSACDTAIISTDRVGRVTSWNAGAHRLFTWSEAEMIGQTLERLFSEEASNDRQLEAEFESAIAHGRSGGGEGWRVRKDGTRFWALGEMTPIRDGSPDIVGFTKIVRDQTAQKNAEDALRELNADLENQVAERTEELRKNEQALRQAQKMEAVGQLTGGVAHDFNNLLTVVLGGLEAIGRQIPLLPESSATARIVRSRDMAVLGVQRAVTLTSRLLAFSRQQPLSPIPLDVNVLVSGISELLRRTIGERITLEAVQGGGLWTTFIDANQLEIALLNLAVNARDAMPQGGSLTIETANAHLDAAYVGTLAEPVSVGQYVLIAVSDTGSGMDPGTLEKAFEPFFTTKPAGKGTGLGLSQVYGFVRQSSGHLRIYSELEEGTTVKLYLPRHLGAAQSNASEVIAQAPHAIGAECILVVEDDEALRAYAAEILHELGYRVVEAASGDEALAALGKNPGMDLLFTDVIMPGAVNGRQLADEAVRLNPGLKVLFTTGYTRNAIVHRGQLDPGIELISKPYTFEELALKVRALLDTGS